MVLGVRSYVFMWLWAVCLPLILWDIVLLNWDHHGLEVEGNFID